MMTSSTALRPDPHAPVPPQVLGSVETLVATARASGKEAIASLLGNVLRDLRGPARAEA